MGIPHWSRYQTNSSIWVLFLTALIVATLGLHWYIGAKLSKVTASLVHASVDIKYQIASFHLTLEELIQGDTSITKEQVWEFLDKAKWHTQALLHGGTNEDGTYHPLTTLVKYPILEKAIALLQQIDSMAQRRLANHQSAGTVADKAFNGLYHQVVDAAESVHQAIHQEIEIQEGQYQTVGLAFAGMLIALAIGAWLILNGKELQRRESEKRNARLARIIAQSINEIYLFDAASYHFMMVNDSLRKNLCYPANEWSLLTPMDIMPEFSEEKFRECLQPLLDKSVASLLFETTHRRKNGTTYDAHVTIQYIDDDPDSLFAAFVQDITEQKKVQQNLLLHDTAMKAAANTIIITDVTGAIQWANPAFTTSSGFTLEEAIGQNPRILKSDKHDVAFYNNLWETIQAGAVWQGVFINKHKDGHLLHEETTITPVHDVTGNIVNFIAIKQDVTERLLANQELQEAKRKAEVANQAKGDFLATMSHEIRTPLNVVLGMLELLKESAMEPYCQEHIQLALGSGKMLLHLINDILDYSKIEANQLVLDTIDFNLRTLLDEVALSMAPLAHVKNIELTLFFPQELPVFVHGDPNRLRQVFINLVSNAIKFTPQGGVVEFHGGPVCREEGGIEFLFEVRDTGIGIPVHEREHIFERFVQANTSNTRQHGGTGLGLAICQRLIHLMGGTIGISCNSFAASGTIFHFTIKLLELSHPPADTCLSGLNGLRVLIVGSHGLQQAMLHNMLHSWGIHCGDVGELGSAFATMANATQRGEPYQVVIVNQWPGQDRPQALAEPQNSDPGWRFLFLIDRLDQGLDQAMELPGNTLCLKKPFIAGQLYATLLGLLHLDQGMPTTSTAPLTRAPLATYDAAAILIVDDHAANLTVTLGMLTKIGCDRSRCATAMNGQQAVELFKQASFDLVFMDCQMPIMDGYQATCMMRQWERQQGQPPIPIIALTADVTYLNRQNGKISGMNDFLAKPVSMDDLRHVLDRHLSVATPHPQPISSPSSPPCAPLDWKQKIYHLSLNSSWRKYQVC